LEDKYLAAKKSGEDKEKLKKMFNVLKKLDNSISDYEGYLKVLKSRASKKK